MNSPLRFSHVSKRYGEQTILEDFSFAFPPTGFVGILGPSGCGKSTLLHIAMGLDENYEGSCLFFGHEGKKSKEMKGFRRSHIGYLPQEGALWELEDALQNALLPGIGERRVYEDRAKALLLRFGLKGKEKCKASLLSGGERQRVLLCRALLLDPEILCCDEPTGALDAPNARMVFAALKEEAMKRLVIVVSHDEALLREFSSTLLVYRNRSFVPRIKERSECPLRVQPRRPLPSLPLSFCLAHAKRRAKEKLGRHLFLEGMLGLGLFLLGLCSYLSDGIQTQIEASFSALVDEEAVVVTAKEKISPSFSLASYSLVSSLAESYPSLFSSPRISLLYDFENSFVDEDDFSFSFGAGEFVLPGYHSRLINDFYLPKELDASLPSSLSTDEAYLGLPYEQLSFLCAKEGIQTSYEALQERLEESPLALRLRIANASWGLDESFTLAIRGIYPSSLPSFAHPSLSWNTDVLCAALGIRLVEGTPSSPQQSLGLPYLTCPSYGAGRKAIEQDERFSSLLLDSPKADYSPTQLGEEEVSSLPRVYCYQSSEPSFWPNLYEEISPKDSLQGYLPISSSFYFASTGSAFSGFSGKAMFTPSFAEAQEAAEECACLPKEEADLPLTLGGNLLDASLQKGSGGVFLRASDALEGDEVLLSSSLDEKWGKPSEIYLAAELSREEAGEDVHRKMRVGELQVKGSFPSSKNIITVPSNWTQDYFVGRLGASVFSSLPEGLVLYSQDKASLSLPSSMEIYDPESSLSSSLSVNLDFLRFALGAFSVFTYLLSLLLLLVTTSLTLKEGEKEDRVLFLLGYERRDAFRVHACSLLHLIARAALSSLLGVCASEILVGVFLGRLFGDLVLSFSLRPLFRCLLFASIGFLFSLLALLGETQKRKNPQVRG